MAAYYNENDPKAAEWLRRLIMDGLIAPGDVDERSIEDVRPAELTGYRQAHFFAGIGGWSYALRLAGWPDDRAVWTGSCPCQPFSAAGKGKGVDDERHLWPAWRWLLDQCRPPVVFGEQVASKAGRGWLAGVRADLEALGYVVGAADLCAASAGEKAKGRISYEDNSFTWRQIVIGAPHIRQRLWWVADDEGFGRREGRAIEARSRERIASERTGMRSANNGSGGRMADTDGRDSGAEGLQRSREHGCEPQDGRAGSWLGQPNSAGWEPREQAAATARYRSSAESTGGHGWMGNAIEPRLEGYAGHEPDRSEPGRQFENSNRPITQASRDSWSESIWIPCADGKARRIESGLEPLVNGLPGRVGLLRGYGNAIVPQVAATFIEAAIVENKL